MLLYVLWPNINAEMQSGAEKRGASTVLKREARALFGSPRTPVRLSRCGRNTSPRTQNASDFITLIVFTGIAMVIMLLLRHECTTIISCHITIIATNAMYLLAAGAALGLRGGRRSATCKRAPGPGITERGTLGSHLRHHLVGLTNVLNAGSQAPWAMGFTPAPQSPQRPAHDSVLCPPLNHH